jgi:hypothetical protein
MHHQDYEKVESREHGMLARQSRRLRVDGDDNNDHDQRRHSSAPLLPLHTSNSSPILYRSVHSFGSSTQSSQASLGASTNAFGPQVPATMSGTNQGYLQGSQMGHNSHHHTSASSNIFPNNAALLIDDNHRSDISEGSYEEYMEDDQETDYDDEPNFEHDCDIEDRATVESQQSSLNSASFSTTSSSSKLNTSSHTPTGEVIAIASGSEDFDIGTMQSAPKSHPEFSTTSSQKSFRRWKKKSLNNNPSESSSLTTSSSQSTRSSRKRSVLRPYGNFSWIVLLARVLPALWISSMIYYCYLYSPPSTIFPIVSQLYFMPDKAHGNHIPLPPPGHKVSVVLMNHSTSSNILKESELLPMLLHHSSVEEVVILHFNPKAKYKFVHPKVVNIDATKENDKMGLSVRFYFCQMAKNDWVLHVDDDLIFSEKTLNEMLLEFSKNTKRIVGRYGRDRKENNHFHGYSSRDTSQETEVILSKFMVMERETCSDFFQYSHLIWEDIVLNNGEGPLWNGEDIFMSLVSNHVHGRDGEKNNYAMDWLEVDTYRNKVKKYAIMNFDLNGGFLGIDFLDFNWWMSLLNKNRHYSYRGKLWKEAKERLENCGPHKPYVAKE